MFSKVVSIVVLIILAGAAVEMKSVHKIGSRINGDRLIVTDRLHSPTISDSPSNHTISFRHPITMVITCIYLYSDANVFAEFVLSYDSVLHGVITAINALEFELTVSVYGVDFKNVPNDFNSPLTPKSQVRGFLNWYNADDEYGNDYDSADYDSVEEIEDALGTEIIAYGNRQEGDELVYRGFESSEATDEPSRHEVIFRFIDNYFLTKLEFKSFEKQNQQAILSHISDHSLKATIQADNVTILFVECKFYGFSPDNKPENYESFITMLDGSEYLSLTSSSKGLASKGVGYLISGFGVILVNLSIWLVA